MIVAKDGSGDFRTISGAVAVAVPGDKILVKPGIYNERVEITVPDITMEGESPENTMLVSGCYARMKNDDGEKLGTFRTYTMLAYADRFTCRNMTIANSSGFGSAVGQAVAVYAEGDCILFENAGSLGIRTRCLPDLCRLRRSKRAASGGLRSFRREYRGGSSFAAVISRARWILSSEAHTRHSRKVSFSRLTAVMR